MAATRLRFTVCSKDALSRRSDASPKRIHHPSASPPLPITPPPHCTLSLPLQVPLLIDKKAIASGLCSQSEYQEILELLISVSDLEARGRTRCAALVPVVHIRALCMKLGRGTRTTGLLTALNQPIELWQRMEEQERNLEENCVDLALEEGVPGVCACGSLHALMFDMSPPSQRFLNSKKNMLIFRQSSPPLSSV